MAPAVREHPEARTKEGSSLIEPSLPKERPARKRMLLALMEAEERYRHELLVDEERLVLHDRIIRLKKKLARLAAS
jgi:hypothetical protein